MARPLKREFLSVKPSRRRLVWAVAGGLAAGLAAAAGLSVALAPRAGGDRPVREDSSPETAAERRAEMKAAIHAGEAYLAGMQHGRALAAFEYARTLAPNDPAPLCALARLDLELRRMSAAEQHLREALALDPQCVPALANLATVVGSMGHPQEAISLLERAQAQDRGNISMSMMLAQNLLWDDQPQRAVDVTENCLKIPEAQGSANLWTLLGQARMQAGHDAPARQALEKAIELDPKSAPPHLHLSQLLLRTGHEQEGQREAAAFKECRQRDERIADLGSALVDRPNDVELLLALARAQLARGFPNRAVGPLQRALSLAPEDPAVGQVADQVQQALRTASSRPVGG